MMGEAADRPHSFKHTYRPFGGAFGVPAPASRMTVRFYIGWALACGLAELVGLAAAAGWWVTMDHLSPDPESIAGKIGMIALKSLAGIVEGGVLGTVQAFVLRRRYPSIDAPAWMVFTTLAAAAGWALASAIPMIVGSAMVSPTLPRLTLGGAVVGGIFGVVQAWVLRRAATGANWWIVGNAAGWAVALPLVYLAASVDVAGRDLAAMLAISLMAGIAAGIAIGAATGLTLWRITPRLPEK